MGQKTNDFPADMVAVPVFGGGAMENWGLVIFGEPAMLTDPKGGPVLSTSNFIVPTVVAHELAHQVYNKG